MLFSYFLNWNVSINPEFSSNSISSVNARRLIALEWMKNGFCGVQFIVFSFSEQFCYGSFEIN